MTVAFAQEAPVQNVTLTGHILDPEGMMVMKATVQASDGLGRPKAQGDVDIDGNFRINVPAGSILTLVATAEGFESVATPLKQYNENTDNIEIHFGKLSSASEVLTVTEHISEPAVDQRDSTIFETFAAYGQLLPAQSFVQVHSGIELPAHPDKVARAYYLRTAVGKTFATGGGLGRRWSPMVEFIADRELVSGATTNWDVVPQLQIPINKRMHLLGSLGMKLPANNREERPRQVLFYLLWDWIDGGLLQGW